MADAMWMRDRPALLVCRVTGCGFRLTFVVDGLFLTRQPAFAKREAGFRFGPCTARIAQARIKQAGSNQIVCRTIRNVHWNPHLQADSMRQQSMRVGGHTRDSDLRGVQTAPGAGARGRSEAMTETVSDVTMWRVSRGG